MTRARFLVAALAVALASPSMAAPDRYKAEATDPATTDLEGRQKRAYAVPWTGHEDFSKWKPASYSLGRPYIIPVLGSPGKAPIFFPPQRLTHNPGVPVDNPVPNRPFRGPGYLPPSMETTTMKIITRFMDYDDEERPIWESSGGPAVADSASKQEIVPTRPPKPPGSPDFPPLVHDLNSGGTNSLAAQSVVEVPDSAPFARMTTTAAAPAAAGPSNCVWAIITCCSADNNKVPDKCFENRGCSGPFWGPSPCDTENAKKALEVAINYYERS